MKNTTLIIVTVIALIVIGGLAFYLIHSLNRMNGFSLPQGEQGRQSAQSNSSVVTGPSIKVGTKNGVGNFLTDDNGMTLYYFVNDTVGKSNCSGSCAAVWPAFFASNINISPNLNAADFGTINRADGATQTTYDGWPLYNYSKDAQVGDTNGQGLGGAWFVATVPFYNLLLENNAAVGTYLADDNGRALYMFADDAPAAAGVPAASKCAGVCSSNWIPFDIQIQAVIPAALNAADFTHFTRGDGKKQLAYKGYPIYRYSKDAHPGDISGNGINGIWFLARPQGFAAAKTVSRTQP
jgi:predicted lipoprotein with Yx(FWY)xxD motif